MSYIKLHRQIQDSKIWDNKEPFDRRSAWIDLLLLASHNERTVIIKNQPVKLQRGDFAASIRFLMKRWHWGNSKTANFITLLAHWKQIAKIKTPIGTGPGTIYHITNYDTYQGCAEGAQYTNQYAGSTPAVRQQYETKNQEEPRRSLANSEKRIGQPDLAYEFFASKFKDHLTIPYQSKKGDFVQLAKLRKRLDLNGKKSCPDGWDKAVKNYFASNLSDWTLADLCVKFHVFRANPVDRFGRRGEQSTEDYLNRLLTKEKSTGSS